MGEETVRLRFSCSHPALLCSTSPRRCCLSLCVADKQCDFIWNNFDHSAYLEKDRALFSRQCESYAFVFFSVVMVGIAFARLYYVYLIRGFYIRFDAVRGRPVIRVCQMERARCS